MSVQEKISAVLFVVVIVIWLLQGFLKDIAPTVGGYISALGNAVPVMVAIVILCLTKVDGKPIMDYKDAAARGVPWSALIFNAAVLVISGALTLEKVGISDFLISNVTPLVSGMNQTIFILVIATLCIIATNFSSNTVCATVFYTISAPIALAMGNINMVALASVIGAAASYAFATPPQHHAHGRGGRHRLGGREGHVQVRRPDGPAEHRDPGLCGLPHRRRGAVSGRLARKISERREASAPRWMPE